MQECGVGATAVQVGRRVLGFEDAVARDGRVEKRVEVNRPTVGVLRPMVRSRDTSAIERRGVVVFHRQFVGSSGIALDRVDLLDGIAEPVELRKEGDDLRRQILIHNQFPAARPAVETDVVYVDPSQLPRPNGATRTPACAQFGGGDGVNGRDGGW